jgi:prepilin-type processing-associated H-X9-DG protein
LSLRPNKFLFSSARANIAMADGHFLNEDVGFQLYRDLTVMADGAITVWP